jgi:hypothetical protein
VLAASARDVSVLSTFTIPLEISKVLKLSRLPFPENGTITVVPLHSGSVQSWTRAPSTLLPAGQLPSAEAGAAEISQSARTAPAPSRCFMDIDPPVLV